MSFFAQFITDAGGASTERSLERIEREQARSSASSQDIARLERQVERLALASQALWELLRATGALSDEQLLAKMQEIDLRDGKVDGKMGAGRAECPECHRLSHTRHAACMYCGAELPRTHVFGG
jgi:hypothetical protein